MSSLLTKLFPGRTRPVRRPAPARPNRTRLGLESLDSRCLMSVTPTLDATSHVLTIQDDSDWHYDRAVVEKWSNNNSVTVWVENYTGNYTKTYYQNDPSQRVDRIVFKGGQDQTYTGAAWQQYAAYDNVENRTNIDSEFFSGAGQGWMKGGGGNNIFHGDGGAATMEGGSGTNYFYTDAASTANYVGGSGTNLFYDNVGAPCDFYAGTGTNVLYFTGKQATGHVPQIQAQYNVTPGPIMTVGVNPGAYTPGTLNSGNGHDMTVSLDPVAGELSLSGPTGAGFRIKGNWTDTRTPAGNGQSTHTFTARGAMTLVTGSALPDIPFNTGNADFRVTTKPSNLLPVGTAPVGELDAINWAGGLPFSLPANNALAGALSDIGLGYNLPGMSWGVKLGSDLKAGAFAGTPLNDAVPYLYVSLGSADGSAASVSYGGLGASVGSMGGVQLAIDPADPFVFAKVNSGTQLGSWAAGYSMKGVIPFTPLKMPDGVSPVVNGNLYVGGSGISLGSLPASVSGEVVLDLDANNDGHMVGVNKQSIKDLLSKPYGAAGSVMNDIALGVNGSVALGYTAAGVDLSIPAGSATLIYSPGVLALRGGHDNPFAGTPLEKFAPKTGEIDIQGYVTWAGGVKHWNVSATGTNRTTGGNVTAAMTYTLDDYTITAKSTYDADFYIAKASLTETFTVGYNVLSRTFNVNGTLTAHLQAGTDGFNIHGDLTASCSMYYALGTHALTVYGNATLSGGVTVFGVSSDFRLKVVIGGESRSTIGTQTRSTGSTPLACGVDAAARGQGCGPWTTSPGFGSSTATG